MCECAPVSENGYIELLASLQHAVSLDRQFPRAVLDLDSSDRGDLARGPDRFFAHFRERNVCEETLL